MPAATTFPPGPALISATRADLCLDFANTRYWRGTDAPTEDLAGSADLVAWCTAQHTLDAPALKRFVRQWKAQPRKAEAAFAEALRLREAIYRIFSSSAGGQQPAAADMEILNVALERVPARSKLHRAAGGYSWEVERTALTVPVLLAPILWSAGDLLAGARLDRVRRCENPKCVWLFLDGSKGGARRWCSMASCGNRAKAHRHYAKTRLG